MSRRSRGRVRPRLDSVSPRSDLRLAPPRLGLGLTNLIYTVDRELVVRSTRSMTSSHRIDTVGQSRGLPLVNIQTSILDESGRVGDESYILDGQSWP